MSSLATASISDVLGQLKKHGARPKGTRPILTLIHSTPMGTESPEPSIGPAEDLLYCRSTEDILDIWVDGVPLLKSGATLPDPSRIMDVFLLHRLLSAALWGIHLPISRLAETMSDPSVFVFAEALQRRRHGREDVSEDSIKTGKYRLNAVFMKAGVEKAISHHNGLGYLLHPELFEVQLVHIPG